MISFLSFDLLGFVLNWVIESRVLDHVPECGLVLVVGCKLFSLAKHVCELANAVLMELILTIGDCVMEVETRSVSHFTLALFLLSRCQEDFSEFVSEISLLRVASKKHGETQCFQLSTILCEDFTFSFNFVNIGLPFNVIVIVHQVKDFPLFFLIEDDELIHVLLILSRDSLLVDVRNDRD